MKKTFILFAALVFAVLSCAAAFAGTYALEKSKIQFSLSDNWKQGDSKIGTSFTSPAGDMIIFFGEVNSEKGVEGAIEAVDKIVEQVMTNVEYGDETESEINGIKLIEVEGKGKSDGKDVFVNVSLMSAGAEAIGFVTSIGDKGAADKNAADLQALVKSFAIAK